MKTYKLTLGTKTNAQYLKALKKLGSVSRWAEDIIGKVEVSKNEQKVEIALLTFADLGITGSYATTQAIRDAAIKRGYELPPAEIALALFQEDIGVGDYWPVLHEPILDSVGDSGVLNADRDGDGRWVDTCWGKPGNNWFTNGAFAFVVPASKPSYLDASARPSDYLPLDAAIAMVKEAGYTVVKIV